MTSPTGNGRRAGFTLVELLVVLSIMCLIAAAIPLTREAFALSSKPAGFARQVLADCLRLRAEAVSKSAVTEFDYSAGQASYKLSPDIGERPIPARLHIALALTDQENAQGVDRLRFFPDGSSDGGVIRVQSETASAKVIVGALTGVPQISSIR